MINCDTTTTASAVLPGDVWRDGRVVSRVGLGYGTRLIEFTDGSQKWLHANDVVRVLR
jgi:hypothetical protein